MGPVSQVSCYICIGWVGGGQKCLCIFLYLSIYVYACVYEQFSCGGYPWRPKEGVRFPGAGKVTSSRESPDVALTSSARAARTPHCLAVFPAPGPFRVRLAPPQALPASITTTLNFPGHCWQLRGGRGNISQLSLTLQRFLYTTKRGLGSHTCKSPHCGG